MGHDMPTKCSPETDLTLVRKGPIKINFEEWAAGILALNSIGSSPSPPPTKQTTSNTSSLPTSSPSSSASPPPSVVSIANILHTNQQSMGPQQCGGGPAPGPDAVISLTPLNGKFSKLVAMIHLIFTVPILDAGGNVVQLDPPTLSEVFLAAVEECTSELSREMIKMLDANIQESEGKSRYFLLSNVDPFFHQPFPRVLLHWRVLSFKRIFIELGDNQVCLHYLCMDPSSYRQQSVSGSSEGYMWPMSCLTNLRLSKPWLRGSVLLAVGKENLMMSYRPLDFFPICSLSLVTFNMAGTSTYPLVLFRMSEFSDFVHDNQFKSLHDKHLPSMPWLPHTLLIYLQKYFQACTPVVTKLKHIRAIINE